MTFPSKFPAMATTIFTKMSALAAEYNAVNLSQGFPDFRPPSELLRCIQRHIDSHTHQYAPMPGLPALRKAIADMHLRTDGTHVDAQSEITITAGATQALFAAIAATVHPGDEVIVLAPWYDSYGPSVELMGGVVVEVPLNQDFSMPTEKISKAITTKTRLIIVNNPHNPSGRVLTSSDMLFFEALAAQYPRISFLFDEVYQHIVFDGAQHHTARMYPTLKERSACVYSFGKSLNATGWKIGYIIANEYFTQEIRKIHQYEVFAVNSFMQAALAEYLPDFDPVDLVVQLQTARDQLQHLLETSRFKSLPSQGTYFQLFDYSEISDLNDLDFTEWLVKEVGVALIPISVFYKNSPKNQHIVRFCFAKRYETLQLAAQRLICI